MMSNPSALAPLSIRLQMHRAHDNGLFSAYFRYIPPLEDLEGSAMFVTYQLGNVRCINWTYPIGYSLPIEVRAGMTCTITLVIKSAKSSPCGIRRAHVSFAYDGQNIIDMEATGIELTIYPEPPLIDRLVEIFEQFVAHYQRVHPEIAPPWYHGIDEPICELYRHDPQSVRFGWLLGSTCNIRFYGKKGFELGLIEHCLRCSQEQTQKGVRELLYPYWYEPKEGLLLVSPDTFLNRWKQLHTIVSEEAEE